MSSRKSQAADRNDPEVSRARRLAALKRYLRAAGVRDPKQRLRLARTLAKDPTCQRDDPAVVDWTATIATVDRLLSREHGLDLGDDAPWACRGRIAQGLTKVDDDREGLNEQLAEGADWAVPAKSHRPMPAQDLSLPRLSMEWLWPAQLWRPAQGLVIGFCCLAVVLIP